MLFATMLRKSWAFQEKKVTRLPFCLIKWSLQILSTLIELQFTQNCSLHKYTLCISEQFKNIFLFLLNNSEYDYLSC